MREPVTYSVVIPVYNDEQMLYDTYKRLKRIIPPIGENYELIFVNDNSTDRSADMLRVFAQQIFGYVRSISPAALVMMRQLPQEQIMLRASRRSSWRYLTASAVSVRDCRVLLRFMLYGLRKALPIPRYGILLRRVPHANK